MKIVVFKTSQNLSKPLQEVFVFIYGIELPLDDINHIIRRFRNVVQTKLENLLNVKISMDLSRLWASYCQVEAHIVVTMRS